MNLKGRNILSVSIQEFILFTKTYFLTVSVECFSCALLLESLQNNDVVLYMSAVSMDGSNCCTDVHEK